MKKYKFFLDFTKEEAWLNKMGHQGLKLLKHENGAYEFEETDQTYQYQIYWESQSLLDSLSGTESRETDFLAFLDEFGIQTVQSYSGRNYLMSEGDGALTLFSNREERIQQLKRARKLYNIQWVPLIIFATFAVLDLWYLLQNQMPLPQPGFMISCIWFLISFKFVSVAYSYSQKIKELERDEEK